MLTKLCRAAAVLAREALLVLAPPHLAGAGGHDGAEIGTQPDLNH